MVVDHPHGKGGVEWLVDGCTKRVPQGLMINPHNSKEGMLISEKSHEILSIKRAKCSIWHEDWRCHEEENNVRSSLLEREPFFSSTSSEALQWIT